MLHTMMLQLELPASLTALLGAQAQASELVKEYLVLGMYQENRISGGKAAELLGLTRRGFVSLLARKGIDYFRVAPNEWQEEVATVKAWNDSRG